MLRNVYREKLLNAILFFAKEVKHPSRVKMFKLLYFLDFLHFKKTGRPVTDQDYYAWKFGPAPKDLWEELRSGTVPEDFKPYLLIETYSTRDERQGFNFKARTKPDLSVFTPREKKLLEDLAFIFKEATPAQMSEISHLHNQPWDVTVRERGEGALIDYLLAIDDQALITKEEAMEISQEREEMFRNYPLKRALPGK